MLRFRDALRFRLERLLLRGIWGRLLIMAATIIIVAVCGGILLKAVGAEEPLSGAIWWAFLRLTDPGYLGDDDGTARRAVSTALTVSGYVLFMGTLIAILNQALQETIRTLQRGETPIVMSGHIVVLGLTERTPTVLMEILRIETRVERFLARIGRRRDLRIVVLVDELDEELRNDLKDELGDAWDDRDIILRSGSALVGEHLERVDFANAAAILIPGGREETDSETNDMRDATVIKTLLSLARHPAIRESAAPPRLIAELADSRLVDVVRPSYPGELALVPSDAIVGRLMVQNLRHHGLSWVLSELMAIDEGANLYFHNLPELNGVLFVEAAERIGHGVALGFVRTVGRKVTAHLNPPSDAIFGEGDRMIIACHSYDGIHVTAEPRSELYRGTKSTIAAPVHSQRRILVLGWSPRLIAVLRELETYANETYTVHIMSVLPAEQRARKLVSAGVINKRVTVTHSNGDYTNVVDVRALDLLSFDNLMIFGRAHLDESEQSDAQTLMGYLIVRDALRGKEIRPAVLVELMDPDNADLFTDVPGEVVLSPTLMGRLLAHLTLRPELEAVLDELFTVGGAEFYYRDPADYGLSEGPRRFDELVRLARAHGELLIGVRISKASMDVSSALKLAPEPHETFVMGPDTRLAVITTMPPQSLDAGAANIDDKG